MILKFFFRATGLLLFLFAPGTPGYAQMFSVESAERSIDTPQTNFHLGLEPVSFVYEGPDGNGIEEAYAFDGPVFRLRYNSGGIDLFMGIGSGLTGLKEVNYFDVGIQTGYGLRLVATDRFALLIPLQGKSSYTSVVNKQLATTSTQFQQGTLSVGAGGYIGGRISERLRFSGMVIPSTGLSFATGGTFGGSIYELEAGARIYLDRLFNQIGISAGYDYQFKRFDIDQDQFDYSYRGHSFLIGITF